jgi:hypothetical protein
MSLTWSEVEGWFKSFIAKGETDLLKVSAIMGEALPIIDAACNAVGGPIANEVVSVLAAISNTLTVVQTAAEPASQAVAAGTITATQAASLAVASANAIAAVKANAAMIGEDMRGGHNH